MDLKLCGYVIEIERETARARAVAVSEPLPRGLSPAGWAAGRPRPQKTGFRATCGSCHSRHRDFRLRESAVRPSMNARAFGQQAGSIAEWIA